MDFLATLLSFSLLASATLCGVRVTRSSLFGYDLGGIASGLTANEAAAKLVTLSARVEAACASSRASLASYYRVRSPLRNGSPHGRRGPGEARRAG